MFNFDGRKGRDEESANRPRQWIWSAKESSATIALVAILGVSLLGAHIFVRARSGNILDRQQAVQNASALINKVTGEGLRYYLGNQTSTRYYFCEDQTGVTGYMVLSFQPEIQQDGSWILNGKQIYCPGESIESQETFKVADDLSWYEYKTSLRDLTSGRTVDQELKYEEGYLQGAITVDGIRGLPPSVVSTGSTNNLIMPGLLDFFSSVATYEDYSEDYSKGVILALPKVEYRGNPNDLLHTELLWVQTGGEAPTEVRSSTPDGRCVEVNWLQSDRFQTVFYDKEHQLVWQKDLPEPASYLRQTTRSDLLAKFPEAESILNQVFRITIDE